MGGALGSAKELGSSIVEMQQHVDGLQKNLVMYLVATDNLSGPLSAGLTGRNRPFIRP
jgi:hypothetical protein